MATSAIDEINKGVTESIRNKEADMKIPDFTTEYVMEVSKMYLRLKFTGPDIETGEEFNSPDNEEPLAPVKDLFVPQQPKYKIKYLLPATK